MLLLLPYPSPREVKAEKVSPKRVEMPEMERSPLGVEKEKVARVKALEAKEEMMKTPKANPNGMARSPREAKDPEVKAARAAKVAPKERSPKPKKKPLSLPRVKVAKEAKAAKVAKAAVKEEKVARAAKVAPELKERRPRAEKESPKAEKEKEKDPLR